MHFLITLLYLFLFLYVCPVSTFHHSTEEDSEFKEQFALATEQERGELLNNLVPNSPSYFHYTLLHLLNTDKANSEEFAKLWNEYVSVDRSSWPEGGMWHWHTELDILKHLKGGSSDEEVFTFLKRKLQLTYDHTKEVGTQDTPPTSYPSKLDLSEIDLILQQYLVHESYLTPTFTPAADQYLLDHKNPSLRRMVLSRLTIPNHELLHELVAQDLEATRGRFGGIPVHRMLTLAQLDRLVLLLPHLFDDKMFVLHYISKVRPGANVNLDDHPEIRDEKLKQLHQFVQRLSSSFNAIKVTLLYHMLKFGQQNGKFDHNLFMEYLRIPKPINIIHKNFGLDDNGRVAWVGLHCDNPLLPHVSVDQHEALIYAYLTHYFSLENTNDFHPYHQYLDEDYVRRIFGESKLLAGSEIRHGLDASVVQNLKDRVDIEILNTHKTFFLPEEEVTLAVAVKNVKTLLVKIFEINTINYYQELNAEVAIDIDLEGLVSSEDFVFEFTEPPIKRINRTFTFPSLNNRRGVFVIELVGNGKASRALVKKGSLNFVERVGANGVAYTVIDEHNKLVSNASILLEGHLFTASKNNEILIPYSTRPAAVGFLLISGSFASLHTINHREERYMLESWINVDRENLIRGNKALVVVKPTLTISGFATTVNILEDSSLLIETTDSDGVATAKVIQPFALHDSKESTYEFQVPDNLRAISFTVQGNVKVFSQNQKTQHVWATKRFSINGQDATSTTLEAYLRYSENGYKICLLGKNGEPIINRTTLVALAHKYLIKPLEFTLQTDADGTVDLGDLTDFTRVEVKAPAYKSWDLASYNKFSYSRVISARTNELIAVPYLGQTGMSRRNIALFEVQERYGTDFSKDLFEKIKLEDNALQFQLPSGDYALFLLDQGLRIEVQVLDTYTTLATRDYLVRGTFLSEYNAHYTRPAYASSISTTETEVTIKVENAGENTRLVVTAGHFVPEFNIELALVPELANYNFQKPISDYVSTRQLGDEYRYILDRKHTPKYPGNSLKRPSILLSPWAIKETTTNIQHAAEGESFASTPHSRSSHNYFDQSVRSPSAATPLRINGISPTYNFLATSSVTLTNLRPNSAGLVKLDRKVLKGSKLSVIVLDDHHTFVRQFGLDDVTPPYSDNTLQDGLNPKGHFTERKVVTAVQQNTSFTIHNVSSSSFEIYDTLPKVFQLYSTISTFDSVLPEFDFLMKWPSLTPVQKQEIYSKYASHEVNFFLYKKDPSFFDSVVKPFIACKKEKTFMDYWLLNMLAPLQKYLLLHHFSKLNIMEVILLGMKFPSHANRITNVVESLFETVSLDVKQYSSLFTTALKLSALDHEEESEKVNYEASEAAAYGENEEENARGILLSDWEVGSKRAFYKSPDITQEWAETNYYKILPSQNTKDLISISSMWRDYAVHVATLPEVKFLPSNISIPTTYTDAIFSLAVVDLPFVLEKPHAQKYANDRMKITASSGFVIFHKELSLSSVVPSNIMLNQNFFDPENRFTHNKGEWIEQYVTDEFLVGKVYGCSIAVTNIGSSTQKLDVLYQIPVGAIPVENGSYTKGKYMLINQYSTSTVTYFFYFPKVGVFKHFPAHATKNQQVLAAAAPVTLKVVDKPSTRDFLSWKVVSQHGTNDQVLAFLSSHNVANINLESIAWRLKDKDFFLQVTDTLRNLFHYHETTWSYAFYHNIPQVISEFLQHRKDFINFKFLQSPYLDVEPIENNFYQHLEYAPLVNARAHQLGHKREILNEEFKAQYDKFLSILIRKRSPSESDLLSITYYLLLQDRVDEALHHFGQITPGSNSDVTRHVSEFQIQYDYMAAYLDLYNNHPVIAPVIAGRYVDFPVTRWNNLFKDVRNTLASMLGTYVVSGKDGESLHQIIEDEDRDREQAKLAQTEPHLAFSVEAKKISITYENIDSCVLSYYLMNIELLFSTNPFVHQKLGRFSYVTPNKMEVISLPRGNLSVSIDLPEIYHNTNVMIDLQTKGIRTSVPYYSHSLNVRVIQNYGQLRVLHETTRQPLSKTYVKVYARKFGGDISFYKDGYTDIAGVFDYASISTNDLDFVDTFSILVMSENSGAIIVEAKPPKQ